tara:strand:+ start:386 stop:829 length:444 start_codon:yes stop_codon:yes gene_type:complete
MSTKKINDFFKNNKIKSFLFYELNNKEIKINDKEQKIENFIVEFNFTIVKVKYFTKDSLKISVTEKDYTKLKNNKDKNLTIHYEANNYKKEVTFNSINFIEKDKEDKSKYIFEIKIDQIDQVINDIINDIYENEKNLEFLKLEKNEI